MLTDKQKRFVELERQKDMVKKYYEDLQDALSELIKEQGLETYFQDERDNTVYKLHELAGRYITFDKYGYSRTKRAGEDRGTLSMREAKERGFNID